VSRFDYHCCPRRIRGQSIGETCAVHRVGAQDEILVTVEPATTRKKAKALVKRLNAAKRGRR
jgi:hypothetical protein